MKIRPVVRAAKALAFIAAFIPMAAYAEPLKPATHMIFEDNSSSSPLTSDRDFSLKAGLYVQRDILNTAALGDRIEMMMVGERKTVRMLKTSIQLNARTRQPAVARWVGARIARAPDTKAPRDDATYLLFTLENADIKCSPRSRVTIISDGIEASQDFKDIDDVLAGKAQLPAPPAGYLRNCAVTMLGIGLTSADSPQLSNTQLRNLKSAWRTYFIAAGVRADQITFVSAF